MTQADLTKKENTFWNYFQKVFSIQQVLYCVLSLQQFILLHNSSKLYEKLLSICCQLGFEMPKTLDFTGFFSPEASLWGRKQPSFQSLLNLLISHNRSKRGFFLNRHIPINSCSFSGDWSINWCKWCRSFYPRSRNATYSLDTLLYSLLKYESRPSNSDCRSSFVTSV